MYWHRLGGRSFIQKQISQSSARVVVNEQHGAVEMSPTFGAAAAKYTS